MKTYPLLQSQLGIFLEWMSNPNLTRYNLPCLVPFPKSFSADHIEKMFQNVCDNRKVLHTRFVIDQEGQPRQYSDPDMELKVKRCKMTDAEFDNYANNEFVRPYDLLSGEPLCRVELVECPSMIYVLFEIHHIIGDGLTLAPNITIKDLVGGYNGQLAPDVEYGMYEYAEDEQKTLQSEVYDRAKQYYADKFVGRNFTSLGSLPADCLGNSIHEDAYIPVETVDAWCKENGVQSNLLFMAAFSYVASVVSREDDVVYSTINHGRLDKRLMDAYGMFVKSTPILAKVNRDLSNLDFIKSFRAELMSTIRYAAYPFNHFCRDLQMQPTIEFGFQGVSIQEYCELDRTRIVCQQLDRGKSTSNLTCIIYLREGKYDIRLSASDAIFKREDLQRLAKAIYNVTNNMMAAPQGKVANLSVMDKEDEEDVAGKRSTAIVDIPWKLFYQPIEENAIKYADRPALIAKDRTLTFAEFNTEANRVAHALMRKGVKRGDRVVLLLPRRSGVIVSMFGVTKAGAAYIPCDPEYPADRINLIMTDSEAQYVITTPDHAPDYPAEKVILIDEIYNTGNTQPEDDLNPNVVVSPEDLAYLIYTSGSTGRPKGVMLRHVGIANYLYPHPANVHIQGLLDLGIKSFVSITTLSFDMSLKEFAGSLFNGITSILADEQEVLDALLLADLMKRTGAEGINGTCSRIMSYMELPAFCEALAHCKAVWSGGEQYPQQLLTNLQTLGVHIFNTYGPTEITVSSNIADLSHAERVSVGRPLLNYVEYVVDPYGNELPVGFVGELLIGGPGVARGYNNLPDMTAERFTEYNGVRVYRSGDLARWLPNGEVEILGRIDSQIKLRGFRIELGEIETVACKFSGIKQAVVDVKEVGAMQHLCLYYTADKEIDQDALMAFMAESLTDYMVPSAYMLLDEIPLTPNGKTNRKALPEPTFSNEDVVQPETETEKKLFDIAAELLGHDQFGVTSNLISMGMSSLALMRFSARILQILGKNIPTKSVMSNPNIRALATMIEEQSEAIQVKAYDKQEYYPLTGNQLGVYVNWELNRDSTQYNIPNMYKYEGIGALRLRDAVETVINAHPILKATMVVRDGNVMMWRRDEQPVAIEVKKFDSAFSVQTFESFMKPFNLLGGDLYHIQIGEYGNTTYLCMEFHHTVFDGFSFAVFRKEIDRALDGLVPEGENFSLFDWALEEKKVRESETYTNAEQYFDNLLGGVDATSYPKSNTPDKKGNQNIQKNVHIEVSNYCKKSGLTENCLFLSLFAEVLHRMTREDNVFFTTIDYGREDLRLGNALGMFVKTLPVVSDKVGAEHVTVKDLALGVQNQLLSSLQNDIYAFTDMSEKHRFRQEIMFDFQGLNFADSKTHAIVPTKEEEAAISLNASKVPINVTVTPLGNDDYQFGIEYDSELYSKADMQILLEAYSNLCANAMTSEKLSCVSMLSDGKQKEILNLYAGMSMAYDASQTFPSIFMQRAAETPDAPAVVDEQGTYSYGELNRLSGALALKLRELGVGSADVKSPFVSIMLGYQKEFLVASIGVEKAGGAYVPLDYDYPNDRLLYMLEDSESQVLITSHIIYNEKTAEGDNFTAKNILFIEDFMAEIADGDYADVNFATPDGLAYMIYTSGSTGKPKGVMIPHRAKTNFVNFIAKEWGHTSKSRICCHSSFSFDASIEDLYPVLTVGGTLYTVPQEARKDLELLHEFIVKNGITGGCYTTQLGQMLLQMYPDLPVDYLVVGGEKMTAAPDCKCRLINTYGPTEFTVDATFFDVEPGKEYKNIPIGRALDNLSAYVVDQYGQLVPQGVAGELCMGGIQMAAGYWKREELTAEKFVDCPFAEGKMYHTGDLVRYNADGQIEYMGRIDSQVKLRGFRIELGEIETLIANYPSVQMVSVQVKEVGGVQHLCAYYSADAEIDSTELKSYLAEQLTDYMVPTAYMQLDEMPLTPNGKVNTKALPVPEIKAEEIIAPKTDTEKKLFDIAVKLLKHDQFGVTNNLISMGLTSLSAMRLTAILQQEIEVTVPVAELLKTPTIREIAQGIDNGKFKSTKKAAIFTKHETPANNPGTEGSAAPKANPFVKKANPFTPKKNPFEKK